METIEISLVRESLLLVQELALIETFSVDTDDSVSVYLKGGREPIRQSLPSTIAFCRGLLEGVRITAKPVQPQEDASTS